MFEYVCALASTVCDAGFGLMVTRPNAAARSLTLEGECTQSLPVRVAVGMAVIAAALGWGLLMRLHHRLWRRLLAAAAAGVVVGTAVVAAAGTAAPAAGVAVDTVVAAAGTAAPAAGVAVGTVAG